MNWKIPLFKTYWDDDDIKSVTSVLKRGTYWADGPEIKEFEAKLAEYLDRRYVVTFNSGTSALHASLLSHDITSGEVIVPSFTFISTANSVLLAGAKAVFAEIEGQTLGLDANDVNERITPKTKAIIPVHYGGCACKDIKALRELCDDHKLLLIEDAAESLGSRIEKEKVGTFGDSAMFSLCQNKVITTGEGGFISTDSEKAYNKLKMLRSHGRFEKNQDYFSTTAEMEYLQLGFNFRMPTMCAALGLSQLRKIDENISKRRKIAETYDKKLSKIRQIGVPSPPKDFFHVYQMYTLQTQDKLTRDGLQDYLIKKGIMSRVYFAPLHLKQLYLEKYGYSKNELPKTESFSDRVLTIPIYPGMGADGSSLVTDSIQSFFSNQL
jgi:dTDP-4-amino-4,6-dideoxygalactose transaminase